jgi:hypothetical protein
MRKSGRFIGFDAMAMFLVAVALIGHVRTLAGVCEFAARNASAAMSCEGGHGTQSSDQMPNKRGPARTPDCPLTAGCGVAVTSTTFVVESAITASTHAVAWSPRMPASLIEAPEPPPPRV